MAKTEENLSQSKYAEHRNATKGYISRMVKEGRLHLIKGKLYRLSAEQGDAQAQYDLGLMYEQGKGIRKDYALAHMWWNICGSSGDKGCVENRNKVEKEMSESQIQKAQEMARNWKPGVKKKSIFEQLRETWDKVTK